MKITKLGKIPRVKSFQCKGICGFCGTEMEASSAELLNREDFRHEYISHTYDFHGRKYTLGGVKRYPEITYFSNCILCKKEVIFNKIGDGD